MCEVILLPERLERRLHIRPQCFTRGFEVEKKDEGLSGDGVENAGGTALSEPRMERGVRILTREDIEEGADVEAVEGAVFGETRDAMADVKFLII